LKEAKLIFASDTRKEAIRRFRDWESKWRIEEEWKREKWDYPEIEIRNL